MQGRGTPIDAERFCDYYESVGWMRGKTKMKDWRAAARQWARNDRNWNKGKAELDDGFQDLLRDFDAGFQSARADS